MTESITSEPNVLIEKRGRVTLLTLNRPHALNALNEATMNDLVAAATAADADPEVGAVVITGSAKAFAAGADIKEMAAKDYMEMYSSDWFRNWENLTRLRIPMIAAVFRLRAGRRLRIGDDVRLHHRR
jgi:enoyl-CoA hydratase